MAEEQKAKPPVALWDAELEQFVNFDPSDVERALGVEGRYFRERTKPAPKGKQ
jgi:hypothetical protein